MHSYSQRRILIGSNSQLVMQRVRVQNLSSDGFYLGKDLAQVLISQLLSIAADPDIRLEGAPSCG